ncbi:MAG: hypothetical protein A4E40_01163 [Methanoregulaceae archaeon PtaU1.Bin059]|nr:MAG: hypothetical protein A4E39_00413 [Methanoregulaceae archaeon PtaB.Bin152]OPY39389.1 MAG: hypothetical protein A4E40_01163 [Methanoregulaceae archaeon PtaU1.Bin059]
MYANIHIGFVQVYSLEWFPVVRERLQANPTHFRDPLLFSCEQDHRYFVKIPHALTMSRSTLFRLSCNFSGLE